MERRMSRREFVKGIGTSAAAVIGGAALGGCSGLWGTKNNGSRGAKGRPNFVIIFCDDLGYSDVGCFGAQGFETPNIDALAREGMRFTDFYVGSPVCTPSRAALMTGCYPQRVGLPLVIHPGSEIGWTECKRWDGNVVIGNVLVGKHWIRRGMHSAKVDLWGAACLQLAPLFLVFLTKARAMQTK